MNLDIPHNLLGKELFRTCFSPHNFWLMTNPSKGTCSCELPGSQSWCRGNPQFLDCRLRTSKQELGSSSSTSVLHTNLGCQKNQRWQRLRVVVNIIYIGFWVWIPTKDAISIPCTCWGHHGSDIVLVPLDSLQASNVPTSNPLTPEFPPLLLIWDRERVSPWIMSRINTFTWATHRKWFG